MTPEPPLPLRRDPEISDELRLALAPDPAELPSDEVLGALRVRLAERVGPAIRLREGASLGTALQLAIREDPSELPDREQLRALATRIEIRRRAARPHPGARRVRPAVVVACLLIACVAAAASYWVSRQQERPVRPPRAPSALLPGARAVPRAPAAESAPRSPRTDASTTREPDVRPPVSSARPKPAGLPSALGEGPSELDLLREAHRLQATDPGGALAAATRHSRLFPSGILTQERELVAIDALTRLGRNEEARARAARFLRQYPGSVHARRIQELVGRSAAPSGAEPLEPERAAGGGATFFSP